MAPILHFAAIKSPPAYFSRGLVESFGEGTEVLAENKSLA
jgi:hypothetical protein